MNLNKQYNPLYIPWFIFDIYNLQLITSESIPSGEITDSKDIVLSETPIPGLGFNPITPGGMGNRKISFTLPLVKRNNTVGNIMLLKQFDALRNQSFGLNLTKIFKKSVQFNPNPKVIFYWGSGSSVPLEWFVKKCDYSHKSSFVNRYGFTQYSEVQIELWLDETSFLYKAEEIFRKLAVLSGLVITGYNIPRTKDQGGKF